MTALDQLRRLLELIPTLADDRQHSIAEVVRRVGIDRATLLSDLRALAERWDDPGGFVEPVSIYVENDRVSINANHFLRPMRLTRAELLALELGLAMLRAERPPDEHPAIDGARTRLRQVLAKLPDEEVADDHRHVATGAPVDAELLSRVRQAARDRRKLRIAYQRADQATVSSRTVCPYALVCASGMWYLVAHCERSHGMRIFRLDRIREVDTGTDRFTVPEGFSVAALVQEGRAFHAAGAGRLKVRYSPRVARWIAEREGKSLDADGSLTIEHPLADLDWAVRHVLQYGPDAEILEPATARAALREKLCAMAGLGELRGSAHGSIA